MVALFTVSSLWGECVGMNLSAEDRKVTRDPSARAKQDPAVREDSFTSAAVQGVNLRH